MNLSQSINRLQLEHLQPDRKGMDPLIPLHRLPLELIIQILEYVLIERHKINIMNFMHLPRRSDPLYGINRFYTRGTDYPVLFQKDDRLRQIASQAWVKANTFRVSRSAAGPDEIKDDKMHVLLQAIPQGYSYLRRIVYRGPSSFDLESDLDNYPLLPVELLRCSPNLKYLSVLLPEFLLDHHAFDRSGDYNFLDHDDVELYSEDSEDSGDLESAIVRTAKGNFRANIAENLFSKMDCYKITTHPGLKHIEICFVQDAKERAEDTEDSAKDEFDEMFIAISTELEFEFAQLGRKITTSWRFDNTVQDTRWIFVRNSDI